MEEVLHLPCVEHGLAAFAERGVFFFIDEKGSDNEILGHTDSIQRDLDDRVGGGNVRGSGSAHGIILLTVDTHQHDGVDGGLKLNIGGIAGHLDGENVVAGVVVIELLFAFDRLGQHTAEGVGAGDRQIIVRQLRRGFAVLRCLRGCG